MPMLGSNGGLIGARRVPTVTTASGIWTLAEQVVARRAGIWPTVTANRYWRMDQFASTTLNNDSLDLTEIRFYENGTLLTGITPTSNLTFSVSGVGAICDGTLNDTISRALINGWAAVRSTARIDFDMGQVRNITGIEIISLYAQPRFPASFVLSSSATNGSGYATVGTITVGTSFTLVSGFSTVYTSGQVAIT